MVGPRLLFGLSDGTVGTADGPVERNMDGSSPGGEGALVAGLDACLKLLAGENDDSPVTRGVWHQMLAALRGCSGSRTLRSEELEVFEGSGSSAACLLAEASLGGCAGSGDFPGALPQVSEPSGATLILCDGNGLEICASSGMAVPAGSAAETPREMAIEVAAPELHPECPLLSAEVALGERADCGPDRFGTDGPLQPTIEMALKSPPTHRASMPAVTKRNGSPSVEMPVVAPFPLLDTG